MKLLTVGLKVIDKKVDAQVEDTAQLHLLEDTPEKSSEEAAK